jgi:DNA repair photolyase
MATLADLQRGAARATPPALPLDVRAVRTFDTPEFAGMTFHEVEAKTSLNRVRGMPFPWSINPYRGCSHACSYCFARPTHTYLNLSPLGDFEKTVVVKTNVVEVLRRELAKPSWRGEHVALGTNTDPYQRCEGRYRLLPGIIGALGESGTPFSVLTKGTLITRDVEPLRAAAARVPVAAALTAGMLDEDLWRESEPGTPSPRARLRAVRELNDAGIPTGVMLAPIMPGLNDDAEQLAALVDAAAAAGAVHITPIVLHLRPGVREVFRPWLAARHPELVQRYAALYRGAEAAWAYREEVTAFVRAQRRAAWRRHGRPPVPAGWRGEPDDRRPPVTADPTGAWPSPREGGAADGGDSEQLQLL